MILGDNRGLEAMQTRVAVLAQRSKVKSPRLQIAHLVPLVGVILLNTVNQFNLAVRPIKVGVLKAVNIRHNVGVLGFGCINTYI